MKVSRKGLLQIISHEGIVLGPYLDSVNVWTLYVGHTSAAGKPNPALLDKVNTKDWPDGLVRAEIAKALELFREDLSKYEDRVNKAITVPLKQHQFDALVSFDFNTGGIFKAALTRDINKGVTDGKGFMGWLKPKEIIKRRTAEQSLFLTGDYKENKLQVAVFDATVSGRPKFRESLRGETILSLMSQTSTIPPKTTPKTNILLYIINWAKLIFKP